VHGCGLWWASWWSGIVGLGGGGLVFSRYAHHVKGLYLFVSVDRGLVCWVCRLKLLWGHGRGLWVRTLWWSGTTGPRSMGI